MDINLSELYVDNSLDASFDTYLNFSKKYLDQKNIDLFITYNDAPLYKVNLDILDNDMKCQRAF